MYSVNIIGRAWLGCTRDGEKVGERGGVKKGKEDGERESERKGVCGEGK